MDGHHDLELILRSRAPIVVIESQDEARILEMLQTISVRRATDSYTPLFRWTITDGLQRLDIDLEPQVLERLGAVCTETVASRLVDPRRTIEALAEEIAQLPQLLALQVRWQIAWIAELRGRCLSVRW